MEGKAPLRLRTFEWSSFVAGDAFEAALIGGLGAVLGLIELQPSDLDRGVIFNTWLSIGCFVVAFTRVWKSIREERETNSLWDQFTGAEADDRNIRVCRADTVDRFFEVPYVLMILALPLSSLFWQGLAGCLLVFYICDNFYNRVFLENVTAGGDKGSQEPETPGSGAYFRALWRSLRGTVRLGPRKMTGPFPNSPQFELYFRKRFRMNQVALCVTLPALILATVLAVFDYQMTAIAVATVHVLFIVGLEAVFEPHRNFGMPVACAETNESE